MIKTIKKNIGFFLQKLAMEKALNIKIQRVADDDDYLYFLLALEEDAVKLASELGKHKPVESIFDEEIKMVRMDMLSPQDRAIRELCR
jgi:hypothetical protein